MIMEIFVIALDRVYLLGMAVFCIRAITKASVFMVSQKKLYADNIKKLNLTIDYSPITLNQLEKADEVIVSNSIVGALQVVRFKNTKWKKGTMAKFNNEPFE